MIPLIRRVSSFDVGDWEGGLGGGWSGMTTSLDWEDDDSSEVDAKLKLTFFLLPCLLVGSREGVSLDVFDDRVPGGGGLLKYDLGRDVPLRLEK